MSGYEQGQIQDFKLGWRAHVKKLRREEGGAKCFGVFRVKNHDFTPNKMNCELMLTYDTPALCQTGSRNLTGQKTLPTIWGTYMKLVTKYQISAINSC